MIRVGIVTTLTNVSTAHLNYWIQYHLRKGISKFFLYLDHITDIKLSSHIYSNTIVWRTSSHKDSNILRRQESNVNDVIKDCLIRKACYIDWLFHIDIDELLFPKNSSSIPWSLKHITTPIVRLKNFEAVKSTPKFLYDNDYICFKEENKFWPGARHAYANGKGGIHLYSNFNKIPRGHVHGFTVSGTTSESIDSIIVLHWPSCHFRQWQHRSQHGPNQFLEFQRASRIHALRDKDGGRAFYKSKMFVNYNSRLITFNVSMR